MRHVTIVRAYYENPETLRRHLDELAAMPEPLLKWLRMIVSDDCSPTGAAEDALRGYGPPPVPVRLFRLDVDVRWNWLGARNVAMHHSDGDWHLITDMDHFAPEDTLRLLVTGEYDPGTVYRFSRRERSGRPVHPHPNSWFMTRDAFWEIGGFDEAFSGRYGSDGEYRRRVALTLPVKVLRAHLVRSEHDGDSSTIRYKRKQPGDGVRDIVRARGPGWRPRVLSFPYHEVRL